MGADYEGQESALAVLRALPSEAKQYIAHHVRNALAGVVGNITLARMDVEQGKPAEHHLDLADQCLWHAIEDLRKFGC